MLGAPHRQPVEAKVSYHVRDRGEGPAKLTQDVLARVRVALYPHVHEALGAPAKKKRENVTK